MLRARCAAQVATSYVRRASFAGALYQAKVDPGELFPFPTSSLPQHVKDAMIEARGHLTAENSDKWGLMIPDHFGGQGFPHPCVFDVVSHMDAATYAPMHPHVLASYVIRSFASKEHMGRYLSTMSDGSTRVGWAVDEFTSPNDVCGETTATFLDAKASFEVTGTKVVCADSNPTAFALLCRISRDGRSSLGFLYVPKDHPGVTYSGRVLRLDKAIIPMDNVFVGMSDGYRTSMTATLTGQYLAAACVTQAARAACNTAPEAVALRIAACAYAVESCAAALAANVEKGVADTFIESASLAGLTRELLDMTRAASPASLDLSTIEPLLSGATPLCKAAACCGIEDAAQVFNATSTLEMMQLRTGRMMGFIDRFPTLEVDSNTVARLEKLILTFGEAVERVAVRQGATLVSRDILATRLGEAGAALYSTAAVLSRSHRAVSAKVASADLEKQIALLWSNIAMDRADRLLSPSGATSADSAHARVAADLLAE